MDYDAYIDAADWQRKARKEGTIADFISDARKAQQENQQRHDVQLEISQQIPDVQFVELSAEGVLWAFSDRDPGDENDCKIDA